MEFANIAPSDAYEIVGIYKNKKKKGAIKNNVLIADVRLSISRVNKAISGVRRMTLGLRLSLIKSGFLEECVRCKAQSPYCRIHH